MKLYSGGLTRFFLGNWQNQDSNLTSEIEVSSEDEEATADEVKRYFETFQSELKVILSKDSQKNFHWSEEPDGPHHVVALEEREFGALLTIAARAAVADKRMVPISQLKEWHADPAVVSIQDAEGPYLPVHHLVKADSWLPADFNHIIETEVPERDLVLGSLSQLASALENMNAILSKPNEVTRKLPAQLTADAGAAFLALKEVVDWATTNGMPILIEP
jgi:hypothetical protein